MSPAKRRTASKPAKGKKAKGTRAARPKSKGKPVRSAPAKRAASKRAVQEKERRHCIATDPFGGPCQSAPRLPSKYCTIHSYLDR